MTNEEFIEMRDTEFKEIKKELKKEILEVIGVKPKYDKIQLDEKDLEDCFGKFTKYSIPICKKILEKQNHIPLQEDIMSQFRNPNENN